MKKDYIELNDNLIAKNGIVGSKYWTLLDNENFFEICRSSFVRKKWAEFDDDIKINFKNKILKPINQYAAIFYPKPELRVFDNYITLTQSTHAEIWLHKRKLGLYALDKCMQRQFYPSRNIYSIDKDKNFKSLYRFYMPWFLDFDINVEILNLQDSFNIYTKNIIFNNIKTKSKNDADWIDFTFLKTTDNISDYKEDDGSNNFKYGIIKRNTPMYSIVIRDKDLITKILDEYEK
jgi:hypothetical protein